MQTNRDLVDIFDSNKIFDYTYGVDIPTQSTSNVKFTRSQTMLSFVKLNMKPVIVGIASYFITDAIHVDRKMRIDSNNIIQVIGTRSEDKDLDLASFRYRVYITPRGILHFFYNNKSKIQIHHMAHHAALFFDILEYVYVRTSLLAYINSVRQGLVFISPHSYKIPYSLNDIFKRYGTITKKTFNKRVIDNCTQYSKMLQRQNSPKKNLDTSIKKDIFEIEV